jgi:predicted nucleic acid-binding protein
VGLTVLDAGVLIAVLDAADPHHVTAREAITLGRERGDRLAVPASAYAETLVAPLLRGASSGDAVDGFLAALPASVEPATREVARRAAELRAAHGSRLRLPDALVVATGIVLGADRIITTDARWPGMGVAVEVVAARSAG